MLQWGPLLTHGNDIESRYVHHNYSAKQGTQAASARPGWGKFWQEVDLMAEGRDNDGEPFAKDEDGTEWKFVFTFSQSDFDMDHEHGLPNYKMASSFCKHCKATNFKRAEIDGCPYGDLGPHARWRSRLVTSNDEFKSRVVQQHPLTESKYFNKYTARNDLMHCADHHGVWGVIFGSVVCYLVQNDGAPSLGATQGERLGQVNCLLNTFYRNNTGVTARIDKLTMKNILPAGSADYATLGGPTIKAANTRQAMPFLQDLAREHLQDIGNLDQQLMRRLIHHTLEFIRVLNSSGVVLTQLQLDDLKVATEGVGKFMQLLRHRAKEQKQLLWHIVPKTHYMQHFPAEARLINPKVVQCYIEESYIGKVAKIWSSSKNGPHKDTIQRVVLLKYLVWLAVEMDL